MDLLTVIRGLAALAVVVWHVEGFLGAYPAVLNVPGRTAVWLFFGMSGYVIAYGFIHRRYRFTVPDLKDFYTNRLLRIYPIFFVLSMLGWAIEFALNGVSPLGIEDIPAQLLTVQFNQNYVLNSVFWTLGIEMHFYLLAPILVLPLLLHERKQQLRIGLGMYVVAIVWFYFAVRHLGWSVDGRNVIANLPHFLTGMIACRVVADYAPSKLRLTLAIVCVALLLMLTNWMYHQPSGRYWTLGSLLIDLVVYFLVVAHASCERRRPTTLGYRMFAFLGTLSYGVYAWHSCLMKYIPQLAGHVMAVIVASILAAYTSYRLIEVPALKLKRSHPEHET